MPFDLVRVAKEKQNEAEIKLMIDYFLNRIYIPSRVKNIKSDYEYIFIIYTKAG